MQPQEPVIEPTVAQSVPEEQTTLKIHTKKIPRQRHFLILFFFSFIWGTFGADRFYMGYIGTGILKLITIGGLGIWTLTDFIVVMTGSWRDKQGRLTLQADEYKKFAGRTVFWFSVILGVGILLMGALLILSIYQLVTMAQGGGSSIPGLDMIKNAFGGQQNQIQDLLQQ